MEWESKSAKVSGSAGSFEPKEVQPWVGNYNPSPETTSVSDSVGQGSSGNYTPSAVAGHVWQSSRNGIDCPDGGTYLCPDMPWESASADRNGSNTNNSD
jgi:hypothetical protein